MRERATEAQRPVISFIPKEEEEGDKTTNQATFVTSLDKVLGKTGPSRTDSSSSRMVTALMRAGRELVTHQPLDQLFETILQLALSAIEAKRGVILTLDDGELHVPAPAKATASLSALWCVIRCCVINGLFSSVTPCGMTHSASRKV